MLRWERPTSSGLHGTSLGSFLVDGNTNGGSFSWTACCHTSQLNPAWLKVDLGTTTVVEELKITGRIGYPGQCTGLTVRVGDAGTESDGICASNVDAEGVDVVVACDSAHRTGRYITIYHSTWLGEPSLSKSPVTDPVLCYPQYSVS